MYFSVNSLASASSEINDFNNWNKILPVELLKQGYRYHKLRQIRVFSKFYRRHSELMSKYNISLKILVQRGLSEPEFYGDFINSEKKNLFFFFIIIICVSLWCSTNEAEDPYADQTYICNLELHQN